MSAFAELAGARWAGSPQQRERFAWQQHAFRRRDTVAKAMRRLAGSQIAC
jgi:hypothetical protein